MQCEICEKSCEQTVKIFVKGRDDLQSCYACVVKLRTKRIYFSKEQGRYRFNGDRRKIGLLRGRV